MLLGFWLTSTHVKKDQRATKTETYNLILEYETSRYMIKQE